MANHTNDWQIKKRIKQYPIKRYPIHRQYFPRLTASYATECSDGSINHVSFSSGRSHKSHAENKVVRKISPRNHEHGIAISFSPCDCCVDKISDKFGQLSCLFETSDIHLLGSQISKIKHQLSLYQTPHSTRVQCKSLGDRATFVLIVLTTACS